MNLTLTAQHLVPALRQSLRAPGLCLIGLDGGRPPTDEEREPWIRIKYGQASADDWVGVVPATARFARERGAPTETLNLIVKINPRVGLARNLIPWIAARNHIVLERPFLQYRSAAELDQTAAREIRSTDWPSNSLSCVTWCRAAMAGRTIRRPASTRCFSNA